MAIEKMESVDIEIDADEKGDHIVLTIKISGRTLILGLEIQEAQVLTSMLHEATTTLLLNKLGLPSKPPETRH